MHTGLLFVSCLLYPLANLGQGPYPRKSFGLSKLVHDATTTHFRDYSNKMHLNTIPLSFIDFLVSVFLVSATAVPRDGFPCVRSASGSTTQPAKCLHNVAKLALHTLHCMSIAAMGML